jgi:hypothetical protein
MVSGLAVVHVDAQGTQRPRREIELSETNSAQILTNLNELTTRKEEFKTLDEQLKMLRGNSAESSLEERFSVPYVSPNMSLLPKKTMKELLERRNTWNLSPEELGIASGATDLDSSSNSKDDKIDSRKSSLQQFYDTLNHKTTNRDKSDRVGDTSTSSGKPVKSTDSLDPINAIKSRDSRDLLDDSNNDDDSKLPPGIRDKAQKLKEMVNEDSSSIFSPTRAHSSFENFFGLSDNSPGRDSLDGPKSSTDSFIDQFKKTLDAQSAGSSIDPALKALAPNTALAQPYTGLGSLPATTPNHELTESSTASGYSVLDPKTIPDMNSAVLNQWNPLSAAPKFEPPKVSLPSPYSMDIPRRHF